MKKLLAICGVCLLGTVSLSAQGRGHARQGAPMGNSRMSSPNTSNAPAGTPHASPDRDFGKDRAADVGRGQQRGLEKDTAPQSTRKAKKNKKHQHGKKSESTGTQTEMEKR